LPLHASQKWNIYSSRNDFYYKKIFVKLTPFGEIVNGILRLIGDKAVPKKEKGGQATTLFSIISIRS
jgi:hypothetical protein